MKIEWKALFIAMDISIISIGFLIIFAISPMISAAGDGMIAQMSWNDVTMILIADFFILTIVFYFLIYAQKAKKSKK